MVKIVKVKKKARFMEREAEIRNKLQASKAVLETLVNGKQPATNLVEIALRDLDIIEKILNAEKTGWV